MAEKKIIINVGRQLGSGGRAIGKLLAEEFGCSFYDKEILNLAAKESGFSESFFEQHDEHKRFFKSLFHLHTQHLSDKQVCRLHLARLSRRHQHLHHRRHQGACDPGDAPAWMRL